jgi:DegV family protein with EDD domain
MILSTDSTSNLLKEQYEKLNIKMTPLQICMDNEIFDDLSDKLPINEFYNKMKNGSDVKTAQVNMETAREYFEDQLSSGKDVLHISFSSTLSGTTPTMQKLAEELNEKHKNKVVVIDSLNASFGEGLLVLLAHDLIEQGKTIDEIKITLEEKRKYISSFFTVEQLKYLVRGGRVSKVSGMIGSLLNIKPILRVNKEGKLVSHKKIISRKKSIQELANICAENIEQGSPIYITHAVSIDDATHLANLIEESTGTKPIINDLTQVIGSHTGPGLLAVFFISKHETF